MINMENGVTVCWQCKNDCEEEELVRVPGKEQDLETGRIYDIEWWLCSDCAFAQRSANLKEKLLDLLKEANRLSEENTELEWYWKKKLDSLFAETYTVNADCLYMEE